MITNPELDHTDHYADLNDLIGTLKPLAMAHLLASHDDPILRDVSRPKPGGLSRWGVDCSSASHLEESHEADFYERGTLIGRINCGIPGLHNLNNATAALAACRMEGIPFARLQDGLNKSPPGRRFDFRGDWEGRLIVDDYAHHPSEVRATLTWPN